MHTNTFRMHVDIHTQCTLIRSEIWWQFVASLTMFGIIWQVQLPCTGCRSTCTVLTSTTGTLLDGSGPFEYASGTSCSWIVSPGDMTQIAITFTDLNVESYHDFIRVYQCSGISCLDPRLVGQLSGDYSNAQTTLMAHNHMMVKFSSDGGVNGDGFAANWKSDAVFIQPSFLSTVCHYILYVML